MILTFIKEIKQFTLIFGTLKTLDTFSKIREPLIIVYPHKPGMLRLN